MRILIDTHCWLWWFLEPTKLNKKALKLIADPSNKVYFSAASAWEIAIKSSLGKLNLPIPPEKYIPDRLAAQSMTPLAIQHNHALRVFSLPHHHRDPFDRLLISQAQIEDLTVLSADKILKDYKIKVVKAD